MSGRIRPSPTTSASSTEPNARISAASRSMRRRRTGTRLADRSMIRESFDIGGLLYECRQANEPAVDVHLDGGRGQARFARRILDAVSLHLDQQDRLRLCRAKLFEQIGQ